MLQEQLKLPSVLVQVCSQSPLSVKHSLMSVILIVVNKIRKSTFVPEQFSELLSSRYPDSQEQKKLPSVLSQSCSQPPLLVAHSSISVTSFKKALVSNVRVFQL